MPDDLFLRRHGHADEDVVKDNGGCAAWSQKCLCSQDL